MSNMNNANKTNTKYFVDMTEVRQICIYGVKFMYKLYIICGYKMYSNV